MWSVCELACSMCESVDVVPAVPAIKFAAVFSQLQLS